MTDTETGSLVIIGGAEDKHGECRILRRLVEMAGGDRARMLILTAAAEEPGAVGATYRRVFGELGVAETFIIHVSDRAQANDPGLLSLLRHATGVFFTGGDQLRLTALLGGTTIDRALRQLHRRGAVIAGTSAGASAMSDTMIVGGHDDETATRNTVRLAPGMGWLPGVVVDQHFAQRGRIGRLLTALAQNPRVLAVGIDEDTAVEVGPAEKAKGGYAAQGAGGHRLGHGDGPRRQ